jgi:exonuclease VII small subunit
MKEFIAKYQKAIVGTGAVSVLLICYFQQKELTKLRAEHKIDVVVGGDIQKAKTIDSLENVIDSIRSENLPLQLQLGRYEVAVELLKEQDKKAADKFELILTTQTE